MAHMKVRAVLPAREAVPQLRAMARLGLHRCVLLQVAMKNHILCASRRRPAVSYIRTIQPVIEILARQRSCIPAIFGLCRNRR